MSSEHIYAIGIGLNLFDARAILLRNDGKVLFELHRDCGADNANDTIKILIELLEESLAKAVAGKCAVKGAGIALGGIVSRKKEVIFWPQGQGFYAHVIFPLKEHLEKKFGIPVILENDANACAWAEHLINFSKNKNLIYMFSGVGAGLIIDGKLYHGKSGVAGEIFLNADHKAMSSRLGEFSFLRQWPAGLEMTKRAKELLSLGKESSLLKKISPTGRLNLKDILHEAVKKDKLAREVVREGAFALGVKAAFLINLLDPEVIIVGGGMEEGGEIFLEECVAAVKTFSLSESRANCKIVMSPLGKKAAPVGAAWLALEE